MLHGARRPRGKTTTRQKLAPVETFLSISHHITPMFLQSICCALHLSLQMPGSHQARRQKGAGKPQTKAVVLRAHRSTRARNSSQRKTRDPFRDSHIGYAVRNKLPSANNNNSPGHRDMSTACPAVHAVHVVVRKEWPQMSQREVEKKSKRNPFPQSIHSSFSRIINDSPFLAPPASSSSRHSIPTSIH